MTATTLASARYVEPTAADARLNRFVAWLTRRGISVWGSRVLAVRGRRSGEWRTTPVNLLELDGHRYLLPDVCLSNGVFLDGTSPADLPRPVEVVATDSRGLTSRANQKLLPRKVTLDFATSPSGGRIVVNGTSRSTPRATYHR